MNNFLFPYTISACFPAYNEAENLISLVANADKALKNCTNDYEIIVVNDGSKDQSKEILEKLSKEYPALKPVHHLQNQGYGATLLTGFKQASKELIFFSDADQQFDLEEIAKLIKLIAEADLVIGYRKSRKDPFHRKMNAFLWNRLIRFVFDVRVKDLDCAFKLFRRSMLEKINLNSFHSKGALISAELLLRFKKANARIREVGVTHYPRQFGQQTGNSPKVILKAFQELWRLYKKNK